MVSNLSTFFTKLNDKLDALANWHAQKTDYAALARMPMTRIFVIMAVFMALFAGLVNYQVRDNQYEVWKSNPDVYFLDQTPLFSTTDASYFLSLARQYEQTGDVNDYNAKRLYPHYQQKLDITEPQDGLTDFPLLSVLIAHLAPDNSTMSLLQTGNALIPLLGFVMALGVLLAFGAAGFWLEGAIAAIGAGICYSFLVRTSIGRIDTDILNLGFFYAVLGLTIFAGRAQSWRAAIIWAVLAGLMLNLFFWWYEKAFMGWAFSIGLVWLSFMTSRDWRRPILLFAIFVVLSGLAFKDLGIGTSYLEDSLQFGALIYPNTFDTITELRVVPFDYILSTISGSVLVGVISLVGLALFAIRYPVLAVVYGPASVFALANFLIGNRAVFYSAPMLWFGFAFFVMVLVRLGFQYLPQIWQSKPFAKEITAFTTFIVLAASVIVINPARDYAPNPTFPKEMMRGFSAMKGNLPENAVIATWWDYGYASRLFNDYATLHDGGAQKTPVTHYVARALLAPSQAETAAILKFLAADGQRGIAANAQSYQSVEKAFAAGPSAEVPPVFLVLTEQMGRWMGSISNLGLWDTENGSAIVIPKNPSNKPLFYAENKCRAGASSSEVICNDVKIDLGKGTVSGQPILRAITQSKNGNQIVGQGFHENAATILHLSDIENAGTRILSFHERLGQTTFHRLFHLGQMEAEHFEMVYDNYPHMRIFQVR